jgi:hypothetical protein
VFFNIVFLKRQTTVTPRGDDPKASWVIHHRENRCFTIYYTLLHINQYWRRHGLCPRLSNLVWRNFKGYCALFWVSFELGPRGNPHPLPTFLLNGPAQEDQLLVLTINVFIQWRNGVFLGRWANSQLRSVPQFSAKCKPQNMIRLSQQ